MKKFILFFMLIISFVAANASETPCYTKEQVEEIRRNVYREMLIQVEAINISNAQKRKKALFFSILSNAVKTAMSFAPAFFFVLKARAVQDQDSSLAVELKKLTLLIAGVAILINAARLRSKKTQDLKKQGEPEN